LRDGMSSATVLEWGSIGRGAGRSLGGRLTKGLRRHREEVRCGDEEGFLYVAACPALAERLPWFSRRAVTTERRNRGPAGRPLGRHGRPTDVRQRNFPVRPLTFDTPEPAILCRGDVSPCPPTSQIRGAILSAGSPRFPRGAVGRSALPPGHRASRKMMKTPGLQGAAPTLQRRGLRKAGGWGRRRGRRHATAAPQTDAWERRRIAWGRVPKRMVVACDQARRPVRLD
jgi:hypothetical protein